VARFAAEIHCPHDHNILLYITGKIGLPIPDVSLRRTARRPNRLTLRRGAADGGELRQAAGAAAWAAANKRASTGCRKWLLAYAFALKVAGASLDAGSDTQGYSF
jgi:hypothetical protein